MIRKTFSFQNNEISSTGQDVNLVLSFSLKGFTLLVFDKSNNCIVSVEEFNFEPSNRGIDSFINEFNAFLEDYLKNSVSFASFHTVVSAETYCLVPDVLFDENKKEVLHSFLFNDNTDATKNIEYSDFLEQNIKFLFAPVQWQKLFANNIENSQKSIDAYSFVQAILMDKSNENGVFVHVAQQTFDVLIVKNKNIHFLNRYSFASAKDFCYHLVGVMNTNELNPFQTDVCFSGDVLPGSDVINLLSKYIHSSKYLVPQDINIPHNLPVHRYFIQLSVL